MSSAAFQGQEWDSIRKFHPEILIEEVTSPSSNHSSSSSPSTSPPSESSSAEYTSSCLETLSSSFESPKDYFSHIREDEHPLVAVVGVGYVGFHLVSAFSKCYKVIAFDVSDKRLTTVAEQLPDTANIHFTSDASCLAAATHFLVAVPTPLLPGTTEIDTTIIQSALDTICGQARRGSTIVIESSVSVGMTRNLLGKMVQEHGLRAGMSPEVRTLSTHQSESPPLTFDQRVDPGRIDPPFESIAKIISGLDDLAPNSLQYIHKLYSRVFKHLVTVSSPEVAEMTKLYENCQRMICIAYANEMADACQELLTPIDPFEVCRAAATKPFGYIPFSPSAGVGGHCIPVNPSYLFKTSRFPLLRRATEKMSRRPAELADRTMRTLLQRGTDPTSESMNRKRKVLVVGIAFKPGQTLITNSPGVRIINHLLDSWDAHVSFADPLVKEHALTYVPRLDEKVEWNQKKLCEFDAIIVVIKQVQLNFDVLNELKGVLIEKYCQ
jgi:nucleotide sugar dehydrogenase